MAEKEPNKYNPLTNAIREALKNKETVTSLSEKYGKVEAGRSLALLTTFEDQETLETLLGEPASDLKVLCDVNFSYALTTAVYENIGIPHFTFGKTFKNQFLLESAGIGNIQPRDSDRDLYAYAVTNQYDAILSCDRNLSGPEDLCFIAREHFTDHGAETGRPPTIALLPKGNRKGIAYLEENGSSIISAIEKREKPFIDITETTVEPDRTLASGPGAWLKNYINQKNKPEP